MNTLCETTEKLLVISVQYLGQMVADYPADWNERRKDVYRRDDFKCQNCGRGGGSHGDVELHAHHIVPKQSGGTHQLSNLKTLCNECHKAVHNDVQAPTRFENQTINSSGSQTSTIIFDTSMRVSSIMYSLSDDDAEEFPFDTTHNQLGILIYSMVIFRGAQSDLLEFSDKNENAPDKLCERYLTSKRIIEYCFGQTLDVDDDDLRTLFNLAMASNTPSRKLQKSLDRDFSEYNTVYEMINEWEREQPKEVPAEFDEFLRLTRRFVEALHKSFNLRKELIAVGPNGIVTLTVSVENQWELKEVDDELESVAPQWWDLFSTLSKKGLREAKNDRSDRPETQSDQSEGCFIATAAMGSSDNGKVELLRDFRDEVLKRSIFGRLFIRFYYRVSPPIAAWISRSKWRKMVVKQVIVNPAVATIRLTSGDVE